MRRCPRHPGDRRRDEARRADAQAKRDGVIWIQAMLPVEEKIALYSHADLFCCPSIYEPFGIINLEAMACETAVVASAVGGIKEVVLPGETGILVPLLQQCESPMRPSIPPSTPRTWPRP
ncbi:glycosyltransferase [Verrucomicrobium spinosum]|uniref:glycosyltransferase n=1 Tax=Verrucomicrobium spinosum TaxID=2736 RepID=UPI000AE0CCAE|nr:glycosyltransferase [Verrucomicrobium spinosum]